MRQNGKAASAIFTAICLGGIVTLFSQTSLMLPESGSVEAHRERETALDPSAKRDAVWGELVPAALERGAEVHIEPPATPANTTGKRLRLK